MKQFRKLSLSKNEELKNSLNALRKQLQSEKFEKEALLQRLDDQQLEKLQLERLLEEEKSEQQKLLENIIELEDKKQKKEKAVPQDEMINPHKLMEEGLSNILFSKPLSSDARFLAKYYSG